MLRHLLAAASIILFSSAVSAAEPVQEPVKQRPVELEQAKERSAKRAEQLNTVTEEQWEAQKDRRADRREKWQTMSAEERREWKSKRKGWKAKKEDAIEAQTSVGK